MRPLLKPGVVLGLVLGALLLFTSFGSDVPFGFRRVVDGFFSQATTPTVSTSAPPSRTAPSLAAATHNESEIALITALRNQVRELQALAARTAVVHDEASALGRSRHTDNVNANSSDSSWEPRACVAAMQLRNTPESWSLHKVLGFKPMRMTKTIGKVWEVVLEGGLKVVMKVTPRWVPTGAGLLLSGDQPSFSMSDTFNCSHWKTLRGYKRGGETFGVAPGKLMGELLVYLVDRALGFGTVPPSMIFAIPPGFWVAWASSYMCAGQDQMEKYLYNLEKKNRGGIVLMAWAQVKVEGVEHVTSSHAMHKMLDDRYHVLKTTSSSSKGSPKGVLEPNETVVLDPSDSDSTANFYKFLFTMWISGRLDVLGNLFAAPIVKDPLRYCRDKSTAGFKPPPLRMINMDNDILSAKGTHMPASIENPCLVPPALRQHLANVGNLTKAVFQVINTSGFAHLLGDIDKGAIQWALVPMSERLASYVRDFQRCK
jgi:hypothetical protein